MSNKNPNIIVHYYIESIRKYGVYPRRVRADMGTENVHVETIQKFLRRNHGDEHASEKRFFCTERAYTTKEFKACGEWSAVRGFSSGWIFFQELTEDGFHDENI